MAVPFSHTVANACSERCRAPATKWMTEGVPFLEKDEAATATRTQEAGMTRGAGVVWHPP
jgi:hypothetical protein